MHKMIDANTGKISIHEWVRSCRSNRDKVFMYDQAIRHVKELDAGLTDVVNVDGKVIS